MMHFSLRQQAPLYSRSSIATTSVLRTFSAPTASFDETHPPKLVEIPSLQVFEDWREKDEPARAVDYLYTFKTKSQSSSINTMKMGLQQAIVSTFKI
jgi:hypothetical protein